MTQANYFSKPVKSVLGEFIAPGDKSISHRALILASIAKGTTTVSGFLSAEDCLKTYRAMQSMGVHIEGPYNDKIIIHGVGKKGLKAPDNIIDCGNSGTTIRLLTGLLVGQDFPTVLTGDESLKKRPMERIITPLTQMGAGIYSANSSAPLSIEGGHYLNGIDYTMPIPSAQVKSCILLAAMYASGDTKIHAPNISRDHTERMLTAFSYPIEKKQNTVMIQSDSELIATDIIVPGDLSSAAFFIVAALIIPDSKIYIRNVGINPSRSGILTALIAMGADISFMNKRLCGEEPVADILVKSSELEGIDITQEMVSLAIDEMPIIMIAASVAKGRTTIVGAKELKYKESDRLKAMNEGLTSIGVTVSVEDDGVIIEGGAIHGGRVSSFNDHRIAMAFTVAGACSKNGIYIENIENIKTSFPQFYDVAKKTGFNLEVDYV